MSLSKLYDGEGKNKLSKIPSIDKNLFLGFVKMDEQSVHYLIALDMQEILEFGSPNLEFDCDNWDCKIIEWFCQIWPQKLYILEDRLWNTFSFLIFLFINHSSQIYVLSQNNSLGAFGLPWCYIIP